MPTKAATLKQVKKVPIVLITERIDRHKMDAKSSTVVDPSKHIKSSEDGRTKTPVAASPQVPPTHPPPKPKHHPIIRSILHFRGLGRRSIHDVRCLLNKLGIPSPAVQFIQFVGAHITEMIILHRFKEDVVNKLATVKVRLDPTFDPLSHQKSFTHATTIKRLGLEEKSEGEKSEAAKMAFVRRLNSMLQSIGRHRRGLLSFLNSLKRAVETGAPTRRFFNPSTPQDQ
jgi:hypothetical protein